MGMDHPPKSRLIRVVMGEGKSIAIVGGPEPLLDGQRELDLR
jgi:hypothetical protein